MPSPENVFLRGVRMNQDGNQGWVDISRANANGDLYSHSAMAAHINPKDGYAYVPKASHSADLSRVSGAQEIISGITNAPEYRIPIQTHKPR